MKRAAAGTAVAAVAIGIVVGVALMRSEPHPYEALRLRSTQDIPGALGFALRPPPDGTRPSLSPGDVERRYPAEGGRVEVAYAAVVDTLEDRSIGPGWVLMARGVCLRNSKGELVSDARGNDPLDLECTDATLWILAVDAATGAPLVALTGYDPDGTFHLDVGRP